MPAKFHRRVRSDLNEVLERYYSISNQLGDDFFAEFQTCVEKLTANPRFFHFDPIGLRRCNLDRFPYHILYDMNDGSIRVWVVRHNQRDPDFGLGRYVR